MVQKKSKLKKKRTKKLTSNQKLELKRETDSGNIMFSYAWWARFRQNWWKILLKMVAILVVFFAIWMAITPIINYQPWFSWWRGNGGSKLLTAPNCFSLTSLAYATHFSLYYQIGNLFSGIQTKLNVDSVLFLADMMYNYAYGLTNPFGILTPKALCQTIIPDSDIYPFIPGGTDNRIVTCLENIQGHKGPLKTYTDWPDQTEIDTWKQILVFWGAAAMCPNEAQALSCSPSSNGKTYCTDTYTPPSNQADGNLDQWVSSGSKYLDDNNNPTREKTKTLNPKYSGNFLWECYNLPHDSLAMRAFISNNATDWNDQALYPDIIAALFGSKVTFAEAGGWFGALQITGGKMSQASLNRIFYAHETPANINQSSSSSSAKCNSGDQISAITTSLGAAGGVGMMGVMCGGALAIPVFGEIACGTAVAIAAVGAGTAAGIGSAASSGCLDSGQCFGDSQKIKTRDRGLITISELDVGDYVEADNKNWDLVYYINKHVLILQKQNF